MRRLEGKVVVITGGAGGMGAVASKRFAAEGARVVVADVGDCESTVSEITNAGGEAIAIRCNVTSAESVASAVATAVDSYGGLHILYNSAGVSLPDDDGPTNTSEATWDATMDVNVKGTWLCCKYAIPAILETLDGATTGGSIINVASFVAHVGSATPQLAYTTSKGAVLSMTRELAVIYAQQGIRVNALCPGPVLTPLLAQYLSDEEKRQRRLVHVPMGRFGTAEEMVAGALFLASDESSFMTGQSLLIDGGITAAYTTPE